MSKWKIHEGKNFNPPNTGWCKDIYKALSDGEYAVLLRKVETPFGEVIHMAIRNISSTDISWSEKQRIKNEIAGYNRLAVEVFPESINLVDEANMYHLWVLPKGFKLPFGLKNEELANGNNYRK